MGAQIGAELAAAAADRTIAGVLVFAGGLTINGSALVDGLAGSLPPGTSISGALAGDGPRFERTWVHSNGRSGEDCVAVVAVMGDSVRFGHGSQGGWEGFGPERTITASDGNVLYALDGQPALTLYKQYLGQRAGELPSSALLFPLTVWSPSDGTSLVRTVLSVDEADQSMTFAGDVPEGWSARLMWTGLDRLIDGATRRGGGMRRPVDRPRPGHLVRGTPPGPGRTYRGGTRSRRGDARRTHPGHRTLQLRGDRPGQWHLRTAQPDHDDHDHRGAGRRTMTTPEWHPTLRRQMARAGLTDADTTEGPIADLLNRVSGAYEDADNQRYLHDRAFTLASAEMQDLYDRLEKASQSAAAVQRDRLKAVFDTAATGLVVLEKDGRIFDLNPVAEILLGLDHDAMVGEPLVSVLIPADVTSPAVADLERALATGRNWRCPDVHLMAGAERHVQRIAAVPAHDHRGRRPGDRGHHRT